MDVSIIYEYLDEIYNVSYNISANQLRSAPCPYCERSDSDLRLYCKSEQDLQDLADRGIENLVTYKFASCHHCSHYFSFFDFARFHDKMTYDEAKEYLESGTGFEKTREERKTDTSTPYPDLIHLTYDAKEYCTSRGITDEMISKYGILYSVSDFLYNDRIIYYKNRIFFPIYSRDGSICGFQGRAMGESKAKYLTAPWMNKSEVLYGCHEYPDNPHHLILCEGVMDKLGWAKIGANSVASFGKSVSDRQIEILKEINPTTLYLAFDSDAIEYSYDFCEKHGHRFNIKIVLMPDKDADEMTCDELANALVNAREYSWEEKMLNIIKKGG